MRRDGPGGKAPRRVRLLKFGALFVMVMIATELISTAAFLSALLLTTRG